MVARDLNLTHGHARLNIKPLVTLTLTYGRLQLNIKPLVT